MVQIMIINVCVAHVCGIVCECAHTLHTRPLIYPFSRYFILSISIKYSSNKSLLDMLRLLIPGISPWENRQLGSVQVRSTG